MVLHALHLCSGYGGFELGLRLAGIDARTVAHVERDAYAAATLVAHMENEELDQAPIWSDLTTFDGSAWRGRVDLITAGFPCQPFSSAGQQRGTDDDRWLWPDIARIVADVEPRFVFLENVPQLVRLGLPHVLSDLAQLGFDAEWGLCSAAEVGAPHRRERIWILADTESVRRVQRDRPTPTGQARRRLAQTSDSPMADTHRTGPQEPDGRTIPGATELTRPTNSGGWPPSRDDHQGWVGYTAKGGPEPSIRRSVDEFTGRVVPPIGIADRLHLLGNGLVPSVAASAFVELLARLQERP